MNAPGRPRKHTPAPDFLGEGRWKALEGSLEGGHFATNRVRGFDGGPLSEEGDFVRGE